MYSITTLPYQGALQKDHRNVATTAAGSAGRDGTRIRGMPMYMPVVDEGLLDIGIVSWCIYRVCIVYLRVPEMMDAEDKVPKRVRLGRSDTVQRYHTLPHVGQMLGARADYISAVLCYTLIGNDLNLLAKTWH